jgi:hypothetical protein
MIHDQRNGTIKALVALIFVSLTASCSGISGSLVSLDQSAVEEIQSSISDSKTDSKTDGKTDGMTETKGSLIGSVRLSEIEPGPKCPEGGTKVEVLSDNVAGAETVVFEKIDCDFRKSAPPLDDPVTFEPCGSNGQKNCIANESFAAADYTSLSAANIRQGVTVAGILGSFTDRPAECIENSQIGCVTTPLFRAADLSGLMPSFIRYGKTIAGVTGVYPSAGSPLEGALGTDLPSLSADVPAGQYQFFKSDGTRVSGQVSDAGILNPGATDQSFSQSLYRGFLLSGDSDLLPGSILSGVNIFGAAGNVALPPNANVRDGTYFGPGGNAFQGEIELCEAPGVVGCVTTEGFKPYPPCTSDGQINCAANTTYQAMMPIVAVVSANVTDADEGESVIFNVATTNIPDGSSIFYTLSGSGITSGDIVSGETSGIASVTGNSATVSVPLRLDYLNEAPETLTLTAYRALSSGSATINNIGLPATLLLSLDGVNGGTTFSDSSANNWAMNRAGDASLSSSAAKFGSSGLSLDGTGDYLTTPANTAFAIGTADFTVDFWCNPAVVNGNDGVFTFGSGSSGLALSLYSSAWTLSNVGGGGNNMGAATAGQWVHIAITRSSNQVRMFVNGVQIGSTLNWANNFTDNQLKIGYYYSPSFSFQGQIDEFRFINGSAAWTSDFTPPALPY